MAAFFFVVCVPREEHEVTIRKRISERNSNITSKQDVLKPTVDVITEIPEEKIVQKKSSLNLKSEYSNNLPNLISSDISSKPCCNENKSNFEPLLGFVGDEKIVKKRFTITRSKSDDSSSAEKVLRGASERDSKGNPADVENKSPKKNNDNIRQKNVSYGKQKTMMDAQTPLETVLTEVLQRLNIKDAVWCPGRENKYYQVFFSLENGAACEEALQLLSAWGVGTRYRSALSVIPCALHYSSAAAVRVYTPAPSSPQDTPDGEHHDDDELDHSITELSAWRRFVLSIKARLTVAQAAELVRADAALTFDWLFLLLVAAFAAAMGLVENSAMFLVASMLISPLMGPIMASTFGTAIRDRSLLLMGVMHEMFGLLLALLVGFLFGLFKCTSEKNFGGDQWPTPEMTSRGEERSLWVGALVAVPSGAAVAIALLGDNTASLVGVAISASLLPPAVNAGLLWAMATMPLFYEADSLPVLMRDSADLAMKGTISLALTLVNIVCVYIGGLLVYKIKDVYPITSEQYWRYEVGETSASASRPTADDPDNEDQWPKTRWRVVQERIREAEARAGAGVHATWSAAPDSASRPRSADLEAYCRQRRSGAHLDLIRPRNYHQPHHTHRHLMHMHGGLPRHSICAQSNIRRMSMLPGEVPRRGQLRVSELSCVQERLRSTSPIFPEQTFLRDLLDFNKSSDHSKLKAPPMTRSRSSSLRDNQNEEYHYGDESIGRYTFSDFDARLNWSADSGAVIGQLGSSQTSSRSSVVGSTVALTEPASDNNQSSKFRIASVEEYMAGKC